MLPTIDQIRAARALLRLSSDTVGNDLSLGQSHLTKIESGKASPRIDTLVRLFDYYVSKGVRFEAGDWTGRASPSPSPFWPSVEQFRAARVLLRSNVASVGEAIGMSRPNITNIELEKTTPRGDTVDKLRSYYTSKGVEFGRNGRVRLRPTASSQTS